MCLIKSSSKNIQLNMSESELVEMFVNPGMEEPETELPQPRDGCPPHYDYDETGLVSGLQVNGNQSTKLIEISNIITDPEAAARISLCHHPFILFSAFLNKLKIRSASSMPKVQVESTILGFPRIGPNRELKKAVETFWKGAVSENDLLTIAKQLRANSWTMQKQLGLSTVPCNDFSLYDQVLDTACMVGAVPHRYKELQTPGDNISLKTYFAMARGIQSSSNNVEVDQPAMEMKKFFDTNYHYLVPELDNSTVFELSTSKPFDEFKETIQLQIQSRPVLIGPVSFLLLSKPSVQF